jgi:RNA 3'-terminal phosphate cyclase (ATP)
VLANFRVALCTVKGGSDVMSELVHIDGRWGEGGGQVLRTALALAAATGQPFLIEHIRANRPKPGLSPQHLTAAKVMAEVSHARVEGDTLGSRSLAFWPTQRPDSAEIRHDVARQSRGGSAGSVTLVLQSLLPASPARLRFVLEGGTHVPWSPPYHYLQWVHLPLLRRMGWDITVELQRWGFYPRGQGCVEGEVRRVGTRPLKLQTRGELRGIVGVSAAARLPEHVGRRQADGAREVLGERGFEARIETRQVDASCPGTAIVLVAHSACSVGGAGALGRRGLPAEEVGRRAAGDLLDYLKTEAALDEYQGDQLVVPAALAAGESVFTVARVTPHLLTNAEVVKAFVGDVVRVDGGLGGKGTVCVKGTPH